jgi:hypothetical protein
MGLGFVLVVWTLLLGCAGLPIAALLAFWSWRRGRLAGTPSKVRAAVAGLLPLVLIAVGLVWFFGYAAYSWTVRRVDPGLGDSWAVPLQHGYFFCMIDVTEHGYLMKDGCTGTPPIYEIRQLAEVGNMIVGTSDRTGAFVFDLTAGQLKRVEDAKATLAELSPTARFQTPDEFYRSRRFGWQGVAALAILFVAEASILWLWFTRFVRARPEPPTQA